MEKVWYGILFLFFCVFIFLGTYSGYSLVQISKIEYQYFKRELNPSELKDKNKNLFYMTSSNIEEKTTFYCSGSCRHKNEENNPGIVNCEIISMNALIIIKPEEVPDYNSVSEVLEAAKTKFIEKGNNLRQGLREYCDTDFLIQYVPDQNLEKKEKETFEGRTSCTSDSETVQCSSAKLVWE